MGCGALCANTNNIIEVSNNFVNIIQKILPLLGTSEFFLPEKEYLSFMSKFEEHPENFQLQLSEELKPDMRVSEAHLQRWRIIIYGVDKSLPEYCNCLGEPRPNELSQDSLQADPKEEELYKNKHFHSIDKDIERTGTIPLSAQQRELLSRILKRISNHFPSMGYTQGINFIVAFLLKIGYSQSHAFWIFVHITLNRRYLLLGFYQENLPLWWLFCDIFKNVLKRLKPSLYKHIYEVARLDEPLWVYKWFTTCFLYSFPFQMCLYVWNLVVDVGSLGMVSFAVSLTIQLEQHIIRENDPLEISNFLDSLSKIDNFNHHLKLNKVVQMAYNITVVHQDLQGVNPENESIYFQYFDIFLQQQNKGSGNIYPIGTTHSKSYQVLIEWYSKLQHQRQDFVNSKKLEIVEEKKQTRSRTRKQNELRETSETAQSNTNSAKEQKRQSGRLSRSVKRRQYLKIQYKWEPSKVRQAIAEINELCDQEDKNSSFSGHSNSARMPTDELDKNIQIFNQSKYSNNHQPKIHPTKLSGQSPEHLKPKYNNFNLNSQKDTLHQVAESVLQNSSFSNVSESVSSRRNKTNQSKKCSSSAAKRSCDCSNNKTDGKKSVKGTYSEVQGSFDGNVEEKSVSNMSVQENVHKMKNIELKAADSCRERTSTQQQLWNDPYSSSNTRSRREEDLEVCSGRSVFKKRGRVNEIIKIQVPIIIQGDQPQKEKENRIDGSQDEVMIPVAVCIPRQSFDQNRQKSESVKQI